jgi:hypothetical protein
MEGNALCFLKISSLSIANHQVKAYESHTLGDFSLLNDYRIFYSLFYMAKYMRECLILNE